MKCKYQLFLILLIIFPLVLAYETDIEHEEINKNSNLPANLQGLVDYKNEQAQFYFLNLSFLIAFLAGIIGLLTPCSLAILPAFFAYSFEGKKEITKMTLMFFFGFAPVFIIFGLLATFFGKTFAMFQTDNSLLVIISGAVLITLGLMVLFGKGFSGFQINREAKKTSLGIFLFGVFFAVGFTACMGPVLVGILLIAGILENYLYAGFLMLFYSLGLFVPLFLISMSFDKFNFSEFINRINKTLGFPLTNLISGVLLIGLGIIFIIYKGTYIFDYLGLGNITYAIYRLQEQIINIKYANVLGILILAGFLFLLWRFLRRKNGNKEG